MFARACTASLTIAFLACAAEPAPQAPIVEVDADTLSTARAHDDPAPPDLEDALASAGDEACYNACGHIRTCAGTPAAEGCEDDCRTHLAGTSAAPAQQYSACAQSLDCATIQKSVAMNMGPLGLCYATAARMAH